MMMSSSRMAGDPAWLITRAIARSFRAWIRRLRRLLIMRDILISLLCAVVRLPSLEHLRSSGPQVGRPKIVGLLLVYFDETLRNSV